jgi:hypothetical protein
MLVRTPELARGACGRPSDPRNHTKQLETGSIREVWCDFVDRVFSTSDLAGEMPVIDPGVVFKVNDSISVTRVE